MNRSHWRQAESSGRTVAVRGPTFLPSKRRGSRHSGVLFRELFTTEETRWKVMFSVGWINFRASWAETSPKSSHIETASSPSSMAGILARAVKTVVGSSGGGGGERPGQLKRKLPQAAAHPPSAPHVPVAARCSPHPPTPRDQQGTKLNTRRASLTESDGKDSAPCYEWIHSSVHASKLVTFTTLQPRLKGKINPGKRVYQ